MSGKDVSLERLQGCTVILAGTPGAVFMKQLRNCVICIGPVSRSLFVDDCSDCTFALACQQVLL
jgi:hypothetical protein